jgi:hypothetical protein
MDIPLFTSVFSAADNDACLDEEEQQRKQKRADKKRRREDAVARDVLAWSSEVLAPSLSELARKAAATGGGRAGGSSGSGATSGLGASSGAAAATTVAAAASVGVLSGPVPLTLHVSGLPPHSKKCHVEAWVLEAVDASDVVEVKLIRAAADGASGSQAHRGFGFVELRSEVKDTFFLETLKPKESEHA